MNDEILIEIDNKLSVIITLLAKSILGEENITQSVVSRKRNPLAYIRGYNALDGSRSLSEIAEIIGVAPSTLSPIVHEWAQIGIIYKIQQQGGVFYKHILPIREKSS